MSTALKTEVGERRERIDRRQPPVITLSPIRCGKTPHVIRVITTVELPDPIERATHSISPSPNRGLDLEPWWFEGRSFEIGMGVLCVVMIGLTTALLQWLGALPL